MRASQSLRVTHVDLYRFAICFVVSVIACATGCISSSKMAPHAASYQASTPEERSHLIYLLRHGWHTGIAVRQCDISPADWPEGAALDGARFVEVGWGDAEFYQAATMWPWVVANAAFLPSRSAIHLSGFSEPLDEFFPESQIVEIDVTAEQVGALCRFIRDSCSRDDVNSAQYLGPAVYGVGGLFIGTEVYFVPKTCNTWTASALAAAECPIIVPLCTLSHGVVFQARKFGRVVQEQSTTLPVLYPFFNFERPRRNDIDNFVSTDEAYRTHVRAAMALADKRMATTTNDPIAPSKLPR